MSFLALLLLLLLVLLLSNTICAYSLSICVFTLLCDKPLHFPASLLHTCVLGKWSVSQLEKQSSLKGMLNMTQSSASVSFNCISKLFWMDCAGKGDSTFLRACLPATGGKGRREEEKGWRGEERALPSTEPSARAHVRGRHLSGLGLWL